MKSRLSLTAILSTFVLTGCVSLSTVPPENYDLSGTWQINAALSDSPSLAAVMRGSGRDRGRGAKPAGRTGPPGGGGGGPQGGGARDRSAGQQGSVRGAVRVAPRGRLRIAALEASKVVIVQNHESMGMEFDGSGYRDVSWGKRVRGELTIDAGWDERDLVVKTTGAPVAVVERYVLSDDGARLRVIFELDDHSFVRVFERS